MKSIIIIRIWEKRQNKEGYTDWLHYQANAVYEGREKERAEHISDGHERSLSQA